MSYAGDRVIHSTSERAEKRFYADNFVDLMGAGLAAAARRPRKTGRSAGRSKNQ
jgi:hypothetical protein